MSELTMDMWYQMNHHDWEYLVDEHNALLAEVNMLRERLIRAYDWVAHAVDEDDSPMRDYIEYVSGEEE